MNCNKLILLLMVLPVTGSGQISSDSVMTILAKELIATYNSGDTAQCQKFIQQRDKDGKKNTVIHQAM